MIARKKISYVNLSEDERELVELCAEGSDKTMENGEIRFVSLLEKEITKLQEQQKSSTKKYISAGSAAVAQMGDSGSGKTYMPKAKSFNLRGKRKGESQAEIKESKKAKVK